MPWPEMAFGGVRLIMEQRKVRNQLMGTVPVSLVARGLPSSQRVLAEKLMVLAGARGPTTNLNSALSLGVSFGGECSNGGCWGLNVPTSGLSQCPC